MFGTVPDYFAQSNSNITILVQIESQQGVDNVDAIAATDGVDGIFVGPSDLAAAFGHLGNASHPDVQRAIQHIFARAKAHGKPCGILAPVEADARRYRVGSHVRCRRQRPRRVPLSDAEISGRF